MALSRIIPLSEGQIGIWHITESSTDLVRDFSTDELDNADFKKYSYEKRKVEWLATRALLKKMIGSDFLITYSEAGKPILHHTVFKFLSISHSRDYLAVYVHKICDVGIDLESIDRNYNSVEKRYLSDAELQQTRRNPILQCLYWCAKEAIFKLVPYEGLEFREHIYIFPFNPQEKTTFSGCFNYSNESVVYSLSFQIFDNHCMVWVSK